MIAPDVGIQILELSNPSDPVPMTDDIGSIMRLFAHASVRTGEFEFTYNPPEGTLKIADWYGWTDVVSIIHNTNVDPTSWVKVLYRLPHWIHVTKDELLPVYDPDRVQRAFHGELKYGYILANPEKIPPNCKMRICGAYDAHAEPPKDFLDVSVSESMNYNNGFKIVTKSGFYNAQCFHLFGADEIDLDAVREWNWK